MKKSLFLTFILAYCSVVNATTYYFNSSIGNDSYSGTDSLHPWVSLSKLSPVVLQPGDKVLLEGGQTFFGQIVITTSGTLTNPIYVGSYGTGKAIITALKPVTLPTTVSNNLYRSSSTPLTPQSDPNIVLMDGVVQQIGRWPNVTQTGTGISNGGWLDNELSTTVALTDSDWSRITITKPQIVNGTTEIFIRSNAFLYQRRTVSSNNNGTFNFNTIISAYKNYGYFLQNGLSMCDVNGEWYYDSSLRQLNMYISSSPASHKIEIPMYDNVINITSGENFVNIDNLILKGANITGISIFNGNDVQVTNCEVYNSGVNAINIGRSNPANGATSNNNTINNCIIDWAGSGGITESYSTNAKITNCTVSNIMPLVGMSTGSSGNGNAINFNITSGLIQYNKVYNAGYNGIVWGRSSNITIKNNLVDGADKTLDDGAAFYTTNDTRNSDGSIKTWSNINVTGNIARNNFGYTDGEPAGSRPISNCFYIDNDMRDVILEGNTGYNSQNGFYLHRAVNITIKNNKTFGIVKKNFWINDDQTDGRKVTGLNVTGNTWFASSTDNAGSNSDFHGLMVTKEVNAGQVALYGVIDSNIYAKPFAPSSATTLIYDNDPAFTASTNDVNLADWKANTIYDDHSKLSPLKYPSTTDPSTVLKYLVNETNTDVNYSLDGNSYVSADSIMYSQNIKLQPYTSVILLKDTTTKSIKLSSIADAYVRDGSYASNNYGSDSTLLVKGDNTNGGYQRLSYLKFLLDSVKAVGSAKLRIYAQRVVNAGNPVVSIFGVNNDSWTESGITYNSAPPSSTSALNTTSIVDSAKYYEFDVTDYVNAQVAGDKKVSFVIKDTSFQNNYIVFSSKESSQNRPELIIVANVALTPSNDAYVRDGSYQGANYGNDTSLVVKKSTIGYLRKSYLKFSLNNIGNVKSAKLRLYGTNEDATYAKVFAYGVNNDSWSESSITWNNAPGSITPLLDSESVNNVAKYYEFDVTNFVKSEFAGDKTASFVIKDTLTQNKLVTFNSKENSKFPPQLVVDYSGDTTTTGLRSIYANSTSVVKSNNAESLLKKVSLHSKAKVYPNPVNNNIHVALPPDYNGNFNLQIIDLLGRTYELGKHDVKAGGYVIDIDIAKLSLKSGQYFIKIISEKQSTQIIKLIVQ